MKEHRVRVPFDSVRKQWEPHAKWWYRHITMKDYDVRRMQNALLPYVLQLQDDDQIIEIAAGANNAVYYPEGFNMQRVTAIDGSKPALELNPSGKKIHADIRDKLPLADSSYNLGVCIFGMRYLENQEEVIQELLRVVKRGSWVYLADFVEGDRRSVRHFNVEELIDFMKETGITNFKTSRLYQGNYNTHTSAMDMLAIQKP